MITKKLVWDEGDITEHIAFAQINTCFQKEEDPNFVAMHSFSQFLYEQKGNIDTALLEDLQKSMSALKENFYESSRETIQSIIRATKEKCDPVSLGFTVLNLETRDAEWGVCLRELGFLDFEHMESVYGDMFVFFLKKARLTNQQPFFLFHEEESKKIFSYIEELFEVVLRIRSENPSILLEKRPSYTSSKRMNLPIYFDGEDGELYVAYQNKSFFICFGKTKEEIKDEEQAVFHATKRLLEKVQKGNRLTYLYKEKPLHFATKVIEKNFHSIINPVANFLGADVLENRCAEMDWKSEHFKTTHIEKNVWIFHEFGVYGKVYEGSNQILLGNSLEDLMKKEQEFMTSMFQTLKEANEETQKQNQSTNTTNTTNTTNQNSPTEESFADVFSHLEIF